MNVPRKFADKLRNIAERWLGDPSVLEEVAADTTPHDVLFEALDDNHPRTREEAIDTLRSMTPEEGGDWTPIQNMLKILRDARIDSESLEEVGGPTPLEHSSDALREQPHASGRKMGASVTTVYRGIFIPGELPESIEDILLRDEDFGIYWSTDFYTAWAMSVGLAGGFATPYSSGYGLVVEAEVDRDVILNDHRESLSRSQIMEMWVEGEEDSAEYIPEEAYERGAEDEDFSPMDILEEYSFEELPGEWLERLRSRGYAWDEDASQFRYNEEEVTLQRGASITLNRAHVFNKYVRSMEPVNTFELVGLTTIAQRKLGAGETLVGTLARVSHSGYGIQAVYGTGLLEDQGYDPVSDMEVLVVNMNGEQVYVPPESVRLCPVYSHFEGGDYDEIAFIMDGDQGYVWSSTYDGSTFHASHDEVATTILGLGQYGFYSKVHGVIRRENVLKIFAAPDAETEYTSWNLQRILSVLPGVNPDQIQWNGERVVEGRKTLAGVSYTEDSEDILGASKCLIDPEGGVIAWNDDGGFYEDWHHSQMYNYLIGGDYDEETLHELGDEGMRTPEMETSDWIIGLLPYDAIYMMFLCPRGYNEAQRQSMVNILQEVIAEDDPELYGDMVSIETPQGMELENVSLEEAVAYLQGGNSKQADLDARGLDAPRKRRKEKKKKKRKERYRSGTPGWYGPAWGGVINPDAVSTPGESHGGGGTTGGGDSGGGSMVAKLADKIAENFVMRRDLMDAETIFVVGPHGGYSIGADEESHHGLLYDLEASEDDLFQDDSVESLLLDGYLRGVIGRNGNCLVVSFDPREVQSLFDEWRLTYDPQINFTDSSMALAAAAEAFEESLDGILDDYGDPVPDAQLGMTIETFGGIEYGVEDEGNVAEGLQILRGGGQTLGKRADFDEWPFELGETVQIDAQGGDWYMEQYSGMIGNVVDFSNRRGEPRLVIELEDGHRLYFSEDHLPHLASVEPDLEPQQFADVDMGLYDKMMSMEEASNSATGQSVKMKMDGGTGWEQVAKNNPDFDWDRFVQQGDIGEIIKDFGTGVYMVHVPGRNNDNPFLAEGQDMEFVDPLEEMYRTSRKTSAIYDWTTPLSEDPFLSDQPGEAENQKFFIFNDGTGVFWDKDASSEFPGQDEEDEDFVPSHLQVMTYLGFDLDTAVHSYGTIESHSPRVIGGGGEDPTEEDLRMLANFFPHDYGSWYNGEYEVEIVIPGPGEDPVLPETEDSGDLSDEELMRQMQEWQKGSVRKEAVSRDLETIRREWAEQGVDLSAYEGLNGITMSLIRTGEDLRGQGLAQAAMEDLVAYADESNQVISLSPTNEFGASKGRLTEWYKSFGFVPNKGRNKDYQISDTMYRLPQMSSLSMWKGAVDQEEFNQMMGADLNLGDEVMIVGYGSVDGVPGVIEDVHVEDTSISYDVRTDDPSLPTIFPALNVIPVDEYKGYLQEKEVFDLDDLYKNSGRREAVRVDDKGMVTFDREDLGSNHNFLISPEGDIHAWAKGDKGYGEALIALEGEGNHFDDLDTDLSTDWTLNKGKETYEIYRGEGWASGNTSGGGFLIVTAPTGLNPDQCGALADILAEESYTTLVIHESGKRNFFRSAFDAIDYLTEREEGPS